MRPRPLLRRLGPARRFLRREDGAGLVEYALVILLFLVLLFAIIDFGRLGFAVVSANKANQIAARIAAVRPPACPGVPRRNLRGSNTTASFGTLCRAGNGTCATPAAVTCLGSASDATATEIFAAVRPLLPPGAGIEDIRFRYAFDSNLGFLGGPYVPVVTVELEDVPFTFVVPVGRSAQGLTLPRMSVSLPGEDLCHGQGGCN
jgi:Flp pilus assembly pilin Flp